MLPRPKSPMACSGRDELDKLVTGLCQVKDASVACLVRCQLPARTAADSAHVDTSVAASPLSNSILQHADLDQRQRDDTVTSFLERVSGQTSHASDGKSQTFKSKQHPQTYPRTMQQC